MYVTQSRLKLVFAGCVLFLVEAVIKTIFVGFPIVEILSFQSGLLLAYVAGKTVSDAKDSEFNCGSVENKPGGEGGTEDGSSK